MKTILKITALSLFLCLLCLLMLTSCQEDKKPSEGLRMEHYTDLNGYAVIGIGSCKDTDIVIPSEYKGKPVVAILSSAFAKNTTITSITLPKSIKSIGQWAFAYCDNLEKIVISEGLETIEDYAFLECYALKKITLPDSVRSIGRNVFDFTAFYLDEANWQNGALYSGKHLIDTNPSIESCQIKDGTLTIAGEAFFNHQNLTSVTVPSSVTAIGKSVFGGCPSLAEIRCEATDQPESWHTDWKEGIKDSTKILWGKAE